MKLLDVVAEVRALVDDAPYAVVGGLAQILWARKTHTDDVDVALAIADLDRGHQHLSYRGTVVDLLSFWNEQLTRAIIDTAVTVPELGEIRFVRPELLLVTHLLRPGVRGALAAVELVLARREAGAFDVAVSERWATQVGLAEKLAHTLRRADEMSLD